MHFINNKVICLCETIENKFILLYNRHLQKSFGKDGNAEYLFRGELFGTFNFYFLF